MTSPAPLEIDLPGGRRGYYNPYSGRYTTSRSYAQRMQRGFARGVSQQTARGQRPAEHIIRRERERERGGVDFPFGFEQRYGFSYGYWQRLRRMGVSEINRRSAPGGRIEPLMVTQVIEAWRFGWRDQNRPELTSWQMWVEVHIVERLAAQRMYQDENESGLGYYNFQLRSDVPPIEFWYYH